MKINYIAPVLDGTGYAHAAINTILALDEAGVDISVTPIKLSGQTIQPHNRVKELIRKPWTKPDVVIQNYLPQMMVYNGGVKNIGYFFSETSQFRSSLWQHYLNLMDVVVTSNELGVEASKRSGVTKPIEKIPIPCNSYTYHDGYPNIIPAQQLGNQFVFYNIGDYSNRKGMGELIHAYLSEFTTYDNVVLVLKTYVEMKTPQQSIQIIKSDIDKIKQSLRFGKSHIFPQIIIIPQYLPDEKIYGLHNQGHCFVTCEKGAAWNIPCFDAIGFGNQVIALDSGGQMEYLPTNHTRVHLVQSIQEVVSGMSHCMYDGVYTGHERWAMCSIVDLMKSMRKAYYADRSKIPLNYLVEKFDIMNAGFIIQEALEKYL